MGFPSMTKTSTKTWNWNRHFLPLLAVAAMGVCTSACGNGLLSTVDDGAAGTGDGGSGGASFGGTTGSGDVWGGGGSVTAAIDCSGIVGASGLDGATGSPGVATLFVPDDLANTLYRYSIAPSADPALNCAIPVPSAESVALRVTGEMFVASYSPPGLYKLTSPFDSPVATGPLAIESVSVLGRFDVKAMTFIDDDLGLTSPGMSGPWFLSFDAQGTPAISWGLNGIPSCAGILWNPDTRILYVSQRFPSGGTVQARSIASDHSQTRLADITGNGLSGPDGMVLTSWGELLVANYYGNAISRFSIDAQGNATPNGTITGNGLSNPTSLALAPWGELFVGNQGSGKLSRFTMDASHNATANGTFQTACKANPGGTGSAGSRLDGIAIFPTPTN
jgi:hypothetical protein